VCRKAKDELFCMGKIPNHIPSGRSWYTDFMELALMEPELTKRLLDAYTAYAIEAAKWYAECGVDGVVIACDWAMNSGPIFPPSFIEEYMVPQVNAIADVCHEKGILVIKHSDGNIMPIEDLFFNMRIDGFQSIEPHAGMSLAEVKRKYGNKITLMGNVDCGRTLPYGTKEQIVEETKACIRDGAPGGGYILSSSNTIMYPISGDALMTMVETVQKYGNYPIRL
jgi:uroporphyrinogen decarboxylase